MKNVLILGVGLVLASAAAAQAADLAPAEAAQQGCYKQLIPWLPDVCSTPTPGGTNDRSVIGNGISISHAPTKTSTPPDSGGDDGCGGKGDQSSRSNGK